MLDECLVSPSLPNGEKSRSGGLSNLSCLIESTEVFSNDT